MTYCTYAQRPCECQPDDGTPCTATDVEMRQRIDSLRGAIKAVRSIQEQGGEIDWRNRFLLLTLQTSVAEDRAEALGLALLGFYNNSTRHDWPDDIYDAAEKALKNEELIEISTSKGVV